MRRLGVWHIPFSFRDVNSLLLASKRSCSTCLYIEHPVQATHYPISILTSGLDRLQIGNHVGPTSASDVGPTSSCSSDRRRADVYVGLTSARRRPNIYCQHFPNVMPAVIPNAQLTNVGPMSGRCQANVEPMSGQHLTITHPPHKFHPRSGQSHKLCNNLMLLPLTTQLDMLRIFCSCCLEFNRI